MYEANQPLAGAGFYCGLVTEKFYETWDFYTELLGFRTLDENEASVLLMHPSGVRLEILRHETNERHAELVSATDGRGFWLNLEVENVDAEYQRLCAGGVQLVHPPENQSLGRRGFTVRDPNGVLICIANPWEAGIHVCTCQAEAGPL
jgi:catechol 2,3-dioxygenase-like lactoylglutathione lyase family enzyme